MENIEMAKTLRDAVKGRNSSVTAEPGVYRWWFDDHGAHDITKELSGVDFSKIQKRIIEGKTYYALYFGIAKNLRQRLNWHLNQRHTTSTVTKGFLSTLRQTLSALLSLDNSKAEEAINIFQDAHCYVEFEATPSREDAEAIEQAELYSKYYPLNIQGNKGVPKEIVNQLSILRNTYKK